MCNCVKNKDNVGKCNSHCGIKKGQPCQNNEDCKKKFVYNQKFQNITQNRYQIDYKQQRGSKIDNKLNWTNKSSLEMYNSLLIK